MSSGRAPRLCDQERISNPYLVRPRRLKTLLPRASRLNASRWLARATSARLLVSISTLLAVLFSPLAPTASAATACTGGSVPSTLVFFSQPATSWPAGVDLFPSFVVRVLCSNGANDTSWSGTISLTLSPSGSFASTGTSITSKSTATSGGLGGSATFGGFGSNLRINTVGNYTIVATATPSQGFGTLATSTAASAAELVIGPSSADHVAITQTPASTLDVGTDITVAVAIQDAFSNLVNTDNDTTVTLVLKTSPAGVTTTFGEGVTSQKVVEGEAAFSELVVDKAGDYQITVTNDAGLGPDPVTNQFTVTPHHLVFSEPPTETVAGYPLPVVVEMRDVSNNAAVTDDNTLIALTLKTSTEDVHRRGRVIPRGQHYRRTGKRWASSLRHARDRQGRALSDYGYRNAEYGPGERNARQQSVRCHRGQRRKQAGVHQ
jgi:hypothetical protein